MKKDVKILINKNIIFNTDISNQAFMSYVGLSICLKPGLDLIYADKNMIYYYLSGMSTSIPRRFDESLRNGLKELIDNKIINCQYKQAGCYYFDIHDFIIKENDTYVSLYLSEIQKIIRSNCQCKISLLRYYFCLASTFIIDNKIKDIRDSTRYNNKIGMVSQEYISEISNISKHTVIEYTKILEELGLLYVSRCSFMFKDVKGNIKRHNNIYGRYIDREIIDEFTKIRYEMYDDLHKVHISSAANNSRSLMQKYNQTVKGKTYDKKIIKDIYNYISEYNQKYPKKKKDMSVFVKYGYDVDAEE